MDKGYRIMKFFNEISKKTAASGCEDEIRSYIKSYLEGFETFTDVHGSLIAHKKGRGKAKMLVTAMDIPSLFETHVIDNGFVRFCSNGIPKEQLMGLRVRFSDGAKGVVYGKDDKSEITDMYIDTGFSGDVLEADPAMIYSPPTKVGNTLSGFAIGSFACMRSVIDAANALEDVNLYVVFLAKTVGRKSSPAFLKQIDEKIDALYCIDKSAASDMPGEENKFITLGGGAVVRVMDKSMMASKRLLDKAVSFSGSVKIMREVSKGISCGSVLHTAYDGIEGISLALPVRYEGEAGECVSPFDIDELTKLIIKNLEV